MSVELIHDIKPTQDRQRTYDATLRRVRANTVAVEKQCVLHNLSVYIRSRSIQHDAMSMRQIVICGLPRPTAVFHISRKARFSGRKKKLTEHKMWVWIFSTTCVWNISHSKKKWARYNKKMYIGLHVRFNETSIFSTDFRKILKYQIS